VSQHPGFPDNAGILHYQKYLEAIGRRAPDDASPTSKLRQLLSDVLVSQVWMVMTKDPADINHKEVIKRYYAKQQPTQDANFVHFNGLFDFNGKQMPRAILKERVAYLGLSPQSTVAERFNPILLDDSKLGGWEPVMFDLIEAILDQPNIDPLLQLAMLRRVVELAGDGSEPLRASLQKLKDKLDAASFDNVAWMNPEAAGVAAPRAVAERAVRSLRSLIDPRKQVLARRDQIEQDVMVEYRPVGWLSRSTNSWAVHFGSPIAAQGKLWVVVPGADKRGQWRQVGTSNGGKPAIDDADASAVAEGRPVFMIIGSR
jgi:hypothetical protein